MLFIILQCAHFYYVNNYTYRTFLKLIYSPSFYKFLIYSLLEFKFDCGTIRLQPSIIRDNNIGMLEGLVSKGLCHSSYIDMGQHMKFWFLYHDINQFKWPIELIYIMIKEPTFHVLAHIHIARKTYECRCYS